MGKNMPEKTAWNASLKLLAAGDKSTSELKSRLILKGFCVEDVDRTLEQLQRKGLVNDGALSESVSAHLLARHQGRIKIEAELEKRGFAASTVQRALTVVTPEVEEEKMRCAAESCWAKSIARVYSKRLQHLSGFLLRRGFSPERVGDFIERWQSFHSE